MATCVRSQETMPVRLHFSRYSFLNSRSKYCSEIGGSHQSRYATLHVPEHGGHAINRHPKVRQRFPSRSSKPFPHTPKASTTLPRGLIKIGRSFPAIGLIFSG